MGWLVALALSFALRLGRFDDRWFQCRAIAENVKRLTWQYSMAAELDGDGSKDEADGAFVRAIEQLRGRVESLAGALAPELRSGETITQWMRQTRQKPAEERLALYRSGRLQDQIDWYTAKASFNGKRESVWFFVLFAAEFGALTIAIVQAATGASINTSAVFASLAAALVAWTQIKRFSDLSSTYLVAAEDLRGFQAIFSNAKTDKLSEIVEKVEQGISREHRVWLVRRAR